MYISLFIAVDINTQELFNLKTVTAFDEDNFEFVDLNPGIFSLTVEVEDAWGAKSSYDLPNRIIVSFIAIRARCKLNSILISNITEDPFFNVL